MTFDDILRHPWFIRYNYLICSIIPNIYRHIRPSQLAERGDPVELAQRLTQSLRDNGELNLAAPNFSDNDEYVFCW